MRSAVGSWRQLGQQVARVGNNVRRQRIGGGFIDLFLFKILFTIYIFQPLIFRAYVRFREGICFFVGSK